MSSSLDSVNRGTRGRVDLEKRWEEVRQKVARAIVADPDIVFFLMFLSSNRARVLAIELSETIESLLAGAEGRRIPQKDVPVEALDGVSVALSAVSTNLAMATPSQELLDSVLREGMSFSKKYLVPNYKQGNRMQQKGLEAAQSYSSAKRDLLRKWPALFAYLAPLLRKSPINLFHVRRKSLEVATRGLQTTVEMPFPVEKASVYALQFVAGLAAVSALGRDINVFSRLSVSPSSKLSVEEYEVVSGFVTKLKIRDQKGVVASPKVLGIKKNDVVSWLGFRVLVSFVGDDYFSLKDSAIPTGLTQILEVLSGPGEAYRKSRVELDAAAEDLPRTDRVNEVLAVFERDLSASGMVRLTKVLGEAASILNDVSPELAKTLDRMGVSIPARTPMSSMLLGYDPLFEKATKSAALDALDLLEQEGFSLAAELLLQGNYSEFLQIGGSMASNTGRFGLAAAGFNEAIGGTHVGVRGRNF